MQSYPLLKMSRLGLEYFEVYIYVGTLREQDAKVGIYPTKLKESKLLYY